ncbi:hypothetical protein [Marinitoga sp. 1138]|uniref:hypothetical protein n=1 Tax=Marinitoga sp. 1138 TaxID=1643334 RepID=UPI0015862498|nr:hypothetical protein [Marinitoga sp. 1138]NUU96728.1 hypothetical protein [Marinitoga sp. 1138]
MSEKYVLVIPNGKVDQKLINDLKKFGLYQGLIAEASKTITYDEEFETTALEIISRNQNIFSILVNMIDGILINEFVNREHENLIFELIEKIKERDKIELFIKLLEEKFAGTQFIAIVADENNVHIL